MAALWKRAPVFPAATSAYIYGVWRTPNLDANTVNYLTLETSTPGGHGVTPDANVTGFITEVSNASGREAIMGSCYIYTLQVVPRLNIVKRSYRVFLTPES